MELQKLLSLTRRCIDTYSLISEGDHIAVGVSAGKDSLSLLTAMKALQRFYPKHFELSAITVDLGLGNLEVECHGFLPFFTTVRFDGTVDRVNCTTCVTCLR